MSLWVDKHRPPSINKLSFHEDLTRKLQSLAACDELPHLLFYDPPGKVTARCISSNSYAQQILHLGAGKKTRVVALLREMYGPGVERMKLEHRTFKTPTNKSIEVTTLGSNYHIECNPSDAGNNDKFIIQEIIKEIASHGNLQGSGSGRTFKVVVLTEVDKLTKQAQASLRRTMEKYVLSCIWSLHS